MPVYIRPARVTVEEGSGGLLAFAVLGAVLTAAAGGVTALVSTIETMLLVALVAAAVTAGALVALLVYVLRRDGRSWRPGDTHIAIAPPGAEEVPGPAQRQISAHRVVPGFVVSRDGVPVRRERG